MQLRQIAELIAERAGRQFEIPFRKEVEDMVVYSRAKLLKDSLSKNPAMKKYYMSSILVKLIEVNKEECEELAECGCGNVLRTDLIPDSIKISPNPFDYVGSEGGVDAYAWTTFGAEKYFTKNPYTAKLARWTLLNNRIYIFREKNITAIRIEGVFSDPRELAQFTCPLSDNAPCYSASQDFPADEALLQQIVDMILSKELAREPKQDDVEIYADRNV